MTMRKMKLIYVWLLGLVAILTACADEEIVKTYNIKEGVPVTVNLKFNVAASAVESRSAQDATVENNVQRLFVIAFKRNGEISGKNYLSAVNSSTGTVTLDMYSGTGQQIFAVANPNSGVGTLSYEQLDAVTNLDDFKNLYSQLRTDKGETVSLSVERMAFLMCGQLEDIAVDTDGNLVGAASNTINLERVDARITFNVGVDGSEKGYTNMTFTPKYYRVENIPQGTYLVPRENEDYAETMTTGYASMQAAGKEYYFDEAKRENDDRSYFEFYLLENRRQPTEEQKITKEKKDASYSEVQNLYALREKRAKTENKVDETKPGQEYVPGDFVFAPENSTYVTIRGTLSFQHGTDFYNADVTYTVHLGSTGSDPDSEELVNNYDVCRNTHYTYNVTITGVESMRVEVQEERIETRPGVEGDVIKAGGEVVDLDSHYGRAKFSLTRGDIKAGLSWAISTPFQRGLKVFDRSNYTVNGEEDGTVVSDAASLSSGQVENLKTGLSLNDYRWVQFAINQECVLVRDDEGHTDVKVPPSAFAKYPGYAAYSSTDLVDEQAPAFGGEGYHYSGSTAIYSQDVVLYDVNQLLNHLFIEANKSEEQGCDLFLKDGGVSYDDDAEVTITAFIDEYVYKYNPTKVYYEIPTALADDDPDLTLWKDFVNAENRMLHICVKGAQYSPDGNTSWAESVITFSQRPIYTFYDPDSDVSTAWGTEFKNESEDAEDGTDKNLPATSSALNGITWNKDNNTFDDGRKNTLEVLGQLTNLKWTDVLYLNDGDYGRLKDKYKSVWFACLGRNRDLDGDNIVDQDEIRWYLASVDQLTDIFIAEAAVPNAKLYSQNATSASVPKEHVISSTYHTISLDENNKITMDPWIIWAEEGASRGVYGSSGDVPSYLHTYRCLRNLGLSLNDKDSDLDDYVKSSHNLDGSYYTTDRRVTVGNGTVTYKEVFIDLSRLEPNTLRAALTGGILPQNKERDDNNRPYRKFAVLVSAEDDRWNSSYTNTSGLYPNGGTTPWTSVWDSEENGNPCPEGYRAPNLRELMLMYTTYPDLFENAFGGQYSFYLCKTGFSFDGWPGYTDGRPGFVYIYESSADYGNLKLLQGWESGNGGKVRCVRDVIGE